MDDNAGLDAIVNQQERGVISMNQQERRAHWVAFASSYSSGQCREFEMLDSATASGAAMFADMMMKELEKRKELSE